MQNNKEGTRKNETRRILNAPQCQGFALHAFRKRSTIVLRHVPIVGRLNIAKKILKKQWCQTERQ